MESRKSSVSPVTPASLGSTLSAGGQGLHIVVAAVDPSPASPAEYREAWGWLTRELAIEERGDPPSRSTTGGWPPSRTMPAFTRILTPTPISWQPNTLANGVGALPTRKRYAPADVAEALRLVAAALRH